MIKKLLQYRDQLFQSKFDRIIYALPEDATSLEVKKNLLTAVYKVHFCRGLFFFQTLQYLESLREIFPNLEVSRGIPEVTIISTEGHCLLILDDLADQLYASAEMGSMFSRLSHHQRISVIISPFPLTYSPIT